MKSAAPRAVPYRLLAKVSGGEWKAVRGPVKLGPRIEPVAGVRLRLKSKIDKERLKELIGGIQDKRFYHLQKLVIWDLDKADFKSIGLVLYMRLGGWSHTGGTYTATMDQVRAGSAMRRSGMSFPRRSASFS